jgi:putative intracellular protease/amidase
MCVVLFLGFYERKIRKEREKRMKRMAIFIDFKFEDLEVMYPKIRLEEEGVEVHVVGVHPKGMKYTGTFETPSSTISKISGKATFKCTLKHYENLTRASCSNKTRKVRISDQE